jgi:hypothetical protein
MRLRRSYRHGVARGRILLLLVAVLLRGHVGLRLMPSLAGPPMAGPVLGLLLAASALLLPLSLVGRNLRWPGARTTATA